ncbi:MAG: ATP/GTP-binding protein [Desulfurococcales archaeon]|nr:ATP/GTP-binding protein [Desulfurococcales archaeon]
MYTLLILGPAGSGKSTLTRTYARWLRTEMGARVYTINLDPAAEYLPYKPDYDIRKIIDARRVARELGLGPNGALVKSMELLSERLEEPLSHIANSEADYVLIDTPGQMEVFLFRETSIQLVDRLNSITSHVAGLYIIDAGLIANPTDYAFQLLLSIAVQLRLNTDIAPVVNKADLLLKDEEYTFDLWGDFSRIRRQLKNTHSLYGEMLYDILKQLRLYARRVLVPRVSAIRGEGLDDLHRIILELQCQCGDLS